MLEIKNDAVLTPEEGYELTKFYVRYFWRTNKFYSLKTEYEEDDVVSIIYLKMLEKDYFSKFDSNVTSKKYYMQRCVQTKMIDLLRRHREAKSLETPVGNEGLVLSDVIPENCETMDVRVEGRVARDRIINQFPKVSLSKIKGYCPQLGRVVGVNYYDLANMVEIGLRPKDMSQFLINPSTGRQVSEGSISKYIRSMREYALDNIVLY